MPDNKLLKQLARISKDVKIVKDVNKNINNLVVGTKWKIIIEGEVKSMAKITIEMLADIVNNGFEKVNSRLDNIEKRLDNIESCPTIKNELELFKKKKTKINNLIIFE